MQYPSVRLLQGSRCEVYMGGSLGVESVQQKEEQAFVARVNTAKLVKDGAVGCISTRL